MPTSSATRSVHHHCACAAQLMRGFRSVIYHLHVWFAVLPPYAAGLVVVWVAVPGARTSAAGTASALPQAAGVAPLRARGGGAVARSRAVVALRQRAPPLQHSCRHCSNPLLERIPRQCCQVVLLAVVWKAGAIDALVEHAQIVQLCAAAGRRVGNVTQQLVPAIAYRQLWCLWAASLSSKACPVSCVSIRTPGRHSEHTCAGFAPGVPFGCGFTDRVLAVASSGKPPLPEQEPAGIAVRGSRERCSNGLNVCGVINGKTAVSACHHHQRR